MAQEVALQPKYNLPRMKSVERISKLPAVEQTVDMANNLYVKVKDTNNLVKSVLMTAEITVKGAMDITLPVSVKFEKPIKMMDSFLCSSLDYVENKIPAVKLPLDEMYKNTRDSLYAIPGVKCACQAGEHGVKKAVEIAFGATQYGSQKFKDVKERLTTSTFGSDDPKSAFAVRASLTAKRLFSLLLSWLWISKSYLSEKKPHSSHGLHSINKKESEAVVESKLTSCRIGTDKGKMFHGFQGEEKENNLINHTKSD